MRVAVISLRVAMVLWAGLSPFAAPQSKADEDPAIVAVREHLAAGRYKDAESNARAALTRIDSRDGQESAAAAAVLDLLIEALWRGNARAEDAQALADRAVALKTRQHGADHPEVAKSLHNAANLLAERGQHRAAQETLERVVRIRESAFGPDDLAVAGALVDLALEVSANANYPRAKTLFERALTIREKRLSPDDLSIAAVLNNLGALLKDMGRYTEAEPLLRRSLAIREKGLGPDHSLVASTLNNLGFLEIERGRYEEARRVYDRVIAINQRVYGETHQVVARTITNVAIATAQGGDYAEARRLFVRALETMEKSLGPRHPDVASAMGNLATMDFRNGDLASARALHERSLALRQATLPAGHADIGESFHNLAAVLRSVGDYGAAMSLYNQALAIREKTYGATPHRAVASTLNQLGAVARDLGQPANAEGFYRRSLAITEQALGATHLQVAQVLTNLATVLNDRRQSNAAESALRRSLSIYEASYGANHPYAAAAHENLAFTFHQRGNHAQAQAEYEQAFAIRSTSLGPTHPELGQGLVGLATELLEQHQYQEAFRIAALAESNSLEHVRTTAATLPERQALTLAATRPTGLDLALTIAIGHPESVPDAPARALDLLVRSRALVLDEMAARQREQNTRSDGNLEAAQLELTATRRRLANLVVRSASAATTTARDDIARARADYEAAERGLAEQHAAFKRQRERGRATLTEIRAALPADARLIAYAKYRPSPVAAGPGADTSRYAAFVVQRDGAVRLVPLDSASRIDALVDTWRVAVTRTAPTRAGEQAARVAGRRLRRAIWDPVASALPASTMSLVVPEGTLNLVNLAALPDDRSGYLVESDAPVHYLSAERDLVLGQSNAQPSDSPGGLLALGGASFGPVPSAAERLAADRSNVEAARQRGECGGLGAVSFEPLPGTAREAVAVVSMWTQSRRGGTSPGPSAGVVHLAGQGATEAAFKRQAPGQDILHLATHGFVVGDRCGRAAADARGVGMVVSQASPPPTANPLRLSGLALAGANRRRDSALNAEDGILTAEEIVSLDLSLANWVVLSACDTGLGEIRAGEGVFGLRRAFTVAGARTTVMSLWSVDDAATLQWMTALYRARLIDRSSTIESVKQANLAMLHARRARKLNTHPFYWAGFVAAGDWR